MKSFNLQLMLAATLLTAIGFADTHAQNKARDVTLVQLDATAERPAMVYRLAGTGTDRDLIALAPQASADDLTRALRLLAGLHERFGADPGRDMAAAVRSEQAPDRPDPRADARRKIHGQFMSDLRRADRREVAGFGKVRTLKIKV